MTWSWFLFKLSTTSALGAVSCNPVGWVVGVPAAQATIWHNWEILEDHNSSFPTKVNALTIAEWAIDYRNNLGLGLIGSGLSSLSSSVNSSIGREAGKEIAKNGGKFTPLARELILTGKNVARSEKILGAVLRGESWVGLKETFTSLINYKMDDEDYSEMIRVFLESLMEKLRNFEGNEKIEFIKNDLKDLKKGVLELNRKNVSTYIKFARNFDRHLRINKIINDLLRSLRNIEE